MRRHVPKGSRLYALIDHCRTHGTISTQEARAIAGCQGDFGSMRKLTKAGWFERVRRGVYEQTFKAAQWHGSLTKRIADAMASGDSFTTDEVAEAVKYDRQHVREHLRWMHKDGQLDRLDVNVYRLAEVARAAGVTGAANVSVTRRGDVMASLVEATR